MKDGECHTTLRSAYLAGPMRGIEHYNFPEFHKQTEWLRAQGWTIFSPAERDEQDERLSSEAGWADGVGLDYFMQFDLAAVCTHDAVILMKGWEGSQGARLEAMVAVEIGHPVFEIEYGVFGRRSLVFVETNRILAEFVAASKGADSLATLEVAR